MDASKSDRHTGGRRTLGERLAWPATDTTETPISEDRAVMARTYAYLFAVGGSLALLTLALPHSPDRNELGLVVPAALAYAMALGFMLGFDRVPLAALKLSPIVGALLATAVIGFGGADAVGAYAMFYFWVVLAACYFFGLRLALAHIGFCAGCYGFVLLVTQPSAPLPALYWLMGVGTLLVAGVLMVLLRVHVERLVTRLASDAGTDPLTGLSNRRAFEDAFARELERSTRTGQPLGLVVLDLDWFKEVNDMLGHLAGDRVLQQLADVLQRETRGIDTVARLGGEEFAVLAPSAGEEEALRLAERLRREVKVAFADHAKPLTISCGIASFPSIGGSSGDVIRAADRALYAAKDLGRDRSVTYRPGETEIAFPDSARLGGRFSARLPSLVALAEAMDRRKGSPGHSRLVGRYSEELARRLGLVDAEVEKAALAGLLHDIGTVGISEATLVKQGALGPEEWAEIRKHPEVGARIVSSADLEGIGEVIHAHHERPDGNGYPLGLSGDEIPLAARIVAVADAYAAMTADRSYRAAIGGEAALAELRAHAGTQFDTELVEAFEESIPQNAPLRSLAEHQK
jgi:diguanylate cyclase (GGDEF)-like protein/putative nucleotidyltransferase with HDIG domain